MKLLTLTTFLLFYTASSLACEVRTFDKVFIFDSKKEDTNGLWKLAIGCTSDELTALKSLIQNSEGMLKESYLARNEKTAAIELKPSRVHVIQIDKLLKKRLELTESQKVLNIKAIDRSGALGASADTTVHVRCQGCDELGKKNIQLNFDSPIKGKKQSKWFTAKIAVLKKALLSRTQSRVDLKPLHKNSFIEKFIYTTKPEQVFSDVEQLSFYRTNKTLKKGQPLLHSELTPVHLVRMGLTTSIIIEGKGLRLTSKGMPMKSGTHGEVINIRNIKSKKVMPAEVVGFNTVRIKL